MKQKRANTIVLKYNINRRTEKYIGILTSDKVMVYNNNLEKEFESEVPRGQKLLIREDGAALVLSTVEQPYFANGDE